MDGFVGSHDLDRLILGLGDLSGGKGGNHRFVWCCGWDGMDRELVLRLAARTYQRRLATVGSAQAAMPAAMPDLRIMPGMKTVMPKWMAVDQGMGSDSESRLRTNQSQGTPMAKMMAWTTMPAVKMANQPRMELSLRRMIQWAKGWQAMNPMR